MKKKRWIKWAIIIAISYLIIGAIAPFVNQKEITKETASNFDAQAVMDMEGSSDRAMLLETNQSAWEERIRLLNQAKDNIVLVTFDMRYGESTQDLASILLHKADEGVKVSILVDGFNGSFRMNGSNFFYALSSHPNITIKLYNPIHLLTSWTSQGRMHDKYVIVDDLGYILGGRNTFDYFIGNYNSYSKSLDREVLIYNPNDEDSSIYQIKDYFKNIWNKAECKLFGEKESYKEKKKVKEQIGSLENRYQSLQVQYPELFESYDYGDNTYATEGVQLLSGSTSIYGKEPEVFYELTELMKCAKNSVTIHTPYAVCNKYMYNMLKEVKKTVPNTHIMLNSIENGDNVFASSDYMRNKDKLINTGIDIYEYDGGTSYHGKTIVIDDNISIIGSYNLDLRSTYVDTELMLVIKSEDFTEELYSNLDRLEADSRKVITKDKYEVPEHLVINELPLYKKIIYRILGLATQPFQYLL